MSQNNDLIEISSKQVSISPTLARRIWAWTGLKSVNKPIWYDSFRDPEPWSNTRSIWMRRLSSLRYETRSTIQCVFFSFFYTTIICWLYDILVSYVFQASFDSRLDPLDWAQYRRVIVMIDDLITLFWSWNRTVKRLRWTPRYGNRTCRTLVSSTLLLRYLEYKNPDIDPVHSHTESTLIYSEAGTT